MSNVVLGHFKDDDYEAQELQDVAHGARHDRHRVRYAHLLVRAGAQVLEVAVEGLSKMKTLGCVNLPHGLN